MRTVRRRHALVGGLALVASCSASLAQAPSLIASTPESQPALERYASCAAEVMRRAVLAGRPFQRAEQSLKAACGPQLLEARRILLQARPVPAQVDQALRNWYAAQRPALMKPFAAPAPAGDDDPDAEETADGETDGGAPRPAAKPVVATAGPVPPLEALLPKLIPLPPPRPADLDVARAGPPVPVAAAPVTAPPFTVPLPRELPPAAFEIKPSPPVSAGLLQALPTLDFLPVDRPPTGLPPREHDPVQTAAVIRPVSPPAPPAPPEPPAAPVALQPAPPAAGSPDTSGVTMVARTPNRSLLAAVDAAIEAHRACLARQIAALGDRFTVDRDLAGRIARACGTEEAARMDLEIAYFGGDERQVRQDVLDLTRMEIVTRLRLARRDAF